MVRSTLDHSAEMPVTAVIDGIQSLIKVRVAVQAHSRLCVAPEGS